MQGSQQNTTSTSTKQSQTHTIKERKMGRSPCCAKQGLNRGAWTPLEDKILTDYIESHGEGKWRSLPQRAGLKRCGKSCRLRWLNYLRPDIKRGNISDDEVDLIIRLHNLLGNRWSLIAGRLPGRTDNEIKNYWNTTIGKKMQGAQASSSKKCKQSSTLSKAVTNLRMNNNEQPIAPIISKNIGSCVVRTKAIRCTKVFIDADIQSTQQPGIIAVTAPSTAHDVRHDFKDDINPTENVHCKAPHSGVVSPTLSGQEGYFPGFAMDFEMNDKLFCDFLNVDMVYDDDFGKGAAESTNDDTHDHQVNVFSPNPCQNGRLHDSDHDLGSMTSFLDPAMDWLIS